MRSSSRGFKSKLQGKSGRSCVPWGELREADARGGGEGSKFKHKGGGERESQARQLRCPWIIEAKGPGGEGYGPREQGTHKQPPKRGQERRPPPPR